MTTQSFNALNGHTIRAIAAVRKLHCKEPTFRPAEPVSGRTPCPKCKSTVHYTVDADGRTSGRCVAAACIRWSLQ